MQSTGSPHWSDGRFQVQTRRKRAIVLRTPDWNDLDALTEWIARLAQRSEVEANLWPLSQEEASQWAGGQLYRWFRGASFFCLAEHEREIVGEVEIIRQPAFQSHVGVLSLGVLPSYRGEGIGRLLLEEGMRRAPEGGMTMIQLSVFSCNQRAFQLYQSCEFHEVGRISGAVRRQDEKWDEILMVKRLENEQHMANKEE